VTLSRREFVGAAALVALGAAPAAADTLPRRQVRALRAAVKGPVHLPGERGYNASRLLFNRRYDGIRPPAVVRVRDAADVRAVVKWADRFDVPLTVRAGGHAYNGASTSRHAVVVDVRALDGVRYADGIATIGPGARNIDVYAKLARHHVTIPSGSCPTVGLGGLATGGGVGLAGRHLGLTIDRVRAYDVVTADGRKRHVSAGDDLYWALRGGGGSFGIVTAVRFDTHPVRRAAFFRVTFPAGSREEALAAWDDLAPGAPGRLTAILTVTSTGASAFGQYFGSERALRALVAPLARVPGASALSTGTAGYLALQRRWAGCADGGLAACHAYDRSTFAASSVYVADKLTGAGRRAFVDAADTGATLILDAYGGAIGQVAPRATAFVHRRVRFSVQILSYTSLAVAKARVHAARRRIAPYGNGQAYQNYADPDLSGARRAYYGVNYERLVRIKTAVDPANRFRLAQGIRPAGYPKKTSAVWYRAGSSSFGSASASSSGTRTMSVPRSATILP
jgi:FAD/FMN-containing dehydrogenase